MPFPNQRVIPTGYAEHHRPAAAGLKTEHAIIQRISDGPAPYPLPPTWTGSDPLWSGLVGVQELGHENGATPAEQPTVTREYRVTVPIEGTPDFRAGERGDIVLVLGRVLRITSITFGSVEFERALVCVDNLTQQNPD
jgi:hypothetical protein